MKIAALIGTGSLLLVLGIAGPVYSQDKPEEKPQEQKAPEEKPAEKPAAKPAARPAAKPAAKPTSKPVDQPAAKPKEDPKTAHDTAHDTTHDTTHDAAHPAAKPAAKPAAQAHTGDQPRPADKPATTKNVRVQNDQTHTAAQQNHGGAGRIPDDKFRAHFGQQHHFHVGHPQMVGGRSQFAYGGYNFYYSQPWPSGWGYEDDVYIIDDGGVYYLVDAGHPGAQLLVTVVL
jgi:hypothetical protein